MRKSSIENVIDLYKRGIKNTMGFIKGSDDFSITAKKIEQEKDIAIKHIDNLFKHYEIIQEERDYQKNYIEHLTQYNIEQALKIHKKGGVR